jgi:hypothetical protein
MYGSYDSLDFGGWAGFLYANRIFNRYGKENKGFMNMKEWNEYLSSPTFPATILE